MTWTWTYEDAAGERVVPETAAEGFPTQAEAEDWIGVTWRDLREEGVKAVTLHEDDRVVYGPMSLDSA